MADDRNSTSPKGTNDKSAMVWDKKPGQHQKVAEKIEGEQNAQQKDGSATARWVRRWSAAKAEVVTTVKALMTGRKAPTAR